MDCTPLDILREITQLVMEVHAEGVPFSSERLMGATDPLTAVKEAMRGAVLPACTDSEALAQAQQTVADVRKIVMSSPASTDGITIEECDCMDAFLLAGDLTGFYKVYAQVLVKVAQQVGTQGMVDSFCKALNKRVLPLLH